MTRRRDPASQRARILEATVQMVAWRGYADTSVAQISGAAGVSTRTFYEHFDGKRGAYLAALDASGAALLGAIDRGYRRSRSFAEAVVECLRAFTEFAAAQPSAATLCVVEVLAASPEATDRRTAAMSLLAGALDREAARDPGLGECTALSAELVIGGICEIAHARLCRGAAGELPSLLPDLAYAALLWFVDAESAFELTETLVGRPPTHDPRSSTDDGRRSTIV